MGDAPPILDINSPMGLFDGIAFRHQMMLSDKNVVDHARYTAYAMICHDQAIGVTAGRVDPNATYVEGQAGWPALPKECLVDKNAAGFEFVEVALSGPRMLDAVYSDCPPIAAPADEHLTQYQRQAALPQGIIDIGRQEGGSGSTIYDLGPTDTWPPGVKTPPVPSMNGHTFIKFGWAGFGYKYQQQD